MTTPNTHKNKWDYKKNNYIKMEKNISDKREERKKLRNKQINKHT